MAASLEERIQNILNATGKLQVRASKLDCVNPDLVILLLEEGFHLPDIAKICGCSSQAVSYQMKRQINGFDARVYTRKILRRKDVPIEKVVAMYKKWKSSTRVAAACSINVHAVLDRLKKAGVEVRSLYRGDIDSKRALELYEKYGTVEAARMLRTNPQLVRDRLKKIGMTFNPRPDRKDITLEVVLELYLIYKNTSKVAEILGVGSDLVRSRLKAKGIEFRRPLPEREIISKHPRKSLTQLAKQYQVSYERIRAIFSRRGIPIIRSCPPREDINPDRIMKLYAKYGTLRKVAEVLDTDSGTLAERLKKSGLRLPKKSERPLPEKEIIDSYPDRSLVSLARQYRVGTARIRRILVSGDVEIRKEPLFKAGISVEKVISLYKKYKSAVRAAEILSTSSTLVYRRLKQAEVKLFRTYVRHVLPEEQIFEEYQKNPVLRDIAKKYHSCPATIKKILIKRGQRKIGLRADIPDEEVVAQFKKGVSINRMVNIYKASANTIERILDANGIERPPLKRVDIPSEEVVRMYGERPRINPIAKHYHTGWDVIKNILVEANVQIVPYFKRQ